jgi:hypothetical protein
LLVVRQRHIGVDSGILQRHDVLAGALGGVAGDLPGS